MQLVGQLRKIDPQTGNAGELPFEFEVMKDNNFYNQRRYEALGEVYIKNIVKSKVSCTYCDMFCFR